MQHSDKTELTDEQKKFLNFLLDKGYKLDKRDGYLVSPYNSGLYKSQEEKQALEAFSTYNCF